MAICVQHDAVAAAVSTTNRPAAPGSVVLEYAQRILADATELQRHANRLRGFESGRVSFGVGAFPAASFLSPLLTQLAQNHPGLSVHVEIESWQRLLEKLQQDKLDFAVAVTHSLPPPVDFAVHPLPPQHGALFVRSGHPLLEVAPKQLRSCLRRYRRAATLLPQRARAYLAEIYRVPDPGELPVVFECDNIPTLRDLTQHSDIVLFCTREAISADLREGRLVALPVALPNAGILTYSVIHRARRTLSPASDLIISRVKRLLEASES